MKSFLFWCVAALAMAGCGHAQVDQEEQSAKTLDGDPLTPLAAHILWEQGTERAFTGAFWDHFESGAYHCINCGELLFESGTKFASHCGWPSFDATANEEAVAERVDRSHGMVRTEVVCGGCGGHIGHVFPDGPTQTGRRYCINSAVLQFRADSLNQAAKSD